MKFRKIKKFLEDWELEQLFSSSGIIDAVDAREECTDFVIPKTVEVKLLNLVFPSRISCAIQIYKPGTYFSPHRDQLRSKIRTHSMSILLNNSFEGGELYIEGDPARLEKGDCALFSPEDLHYVEGVYEGKRLVLSAWGVK